MNGPEFFTFLFHIGLALLTAAIARSKGRSAIGWFLFAFFFHVIALVVVLFASDLTEIDRKIERRDTRVDRLREQVRQERIKTETFRAEASARLDAHDRMAKIDTRPEGALAAGLEPPHLPAGDEPRWYFESEGQARGPEPQSALRLRLARAELTEDTLVWREGFEEWVPARACSELLS